VPHIWDMVTNGSDGSSRYNRYFCTRCGHLCVRSVLEDDPSPDLTANVYVHESDVRYSMTCEEIIIYRTIAE